MLVIFCFALLMLLGIFVVVFALKSLSQQKKGGGAESNVTIPWFGDKIELKGPAWLLLVAMGALMVASPVLAAFAQKPSDVTRPPVTVQEVQQHESLADENLSSFQFVSDLSLLDLRQSQKTPWFSMIRGLLNKEEGKKTKPAILRDVMVVRKTTDAKEMVFSLSTTGTLVVRCLSHPAKYQEKHSIKDGKPTDTWAVLIDVSNMPKDENFEVVVEATYYDAFSTPETSDYTTYANKQSEKEKISVVLMFPDDKPMKTIGEMEYPPTGGQGVNFTGTARSFQDPEGHSYYWTTDNIRSNYYFKLFWTW